MISKKVGVSLLEIPIPEIKLLNGVRDWEMIFTIGFNLNDFMIVYL